MRRRNSELRADEARAAWDAAQPPAAATAVRAKYELMTPMYGGGVAPSEVDRTMPIRPTAIRGQLRFWWPPAEWRRARAEGSVRAPSPICGAASPGRDRAPVE